MNTYRSRTTGHGLASMLGGRQLNRGAAFGVIIIGALVAFEIFNYSTTEFALNDVLGSLRFMGIRWSTILAIAFCGIDFAGIARLFTPEQGRDEPAEVWYLFGAWLLAAGMNAMLTWWGVAIAIVNHTSLAGGTIVSNSTLTKVIPICVAVMVWLIRVLIIGTFSMAGDRLFSQENAAAYGRLIPANVEGMRTVRPPVGATKPAAALRPSPKPLARPGAAYARQEPSYHSPSLGARPAHTIGERSYTDSASRLREQ